MARFTLAIAALLGLAHQALGDLQPCGQAQYDPAQVSRHLFQPKAQRPC